MSKDGDHEALRAALEARSETLLAGWLEEAFETEDSAVRRAAGELDVPVTPPLTDLGRRILSMLANGDPRDLTEWLGGQSLAMYSDRVTLAATQLLMARTQQVLLEAGIRGGEAELIASMPTLQARCAELSSMMLDAMVRRVRAAMPAEATEFQEMASVLKDTLYSTLAGGMIRYVSPSIEPLTGYTMEDFLNDQQLWSKLVVPEDLDTYRTLYSGVISRREPMEAVYRLQHGKTERIHHVLDRVTPVMGPDGDVIRLDGILIDITDRVEFEARLERAEQLRILGQLARDVAHDFNNLLVSILGHTDILLSRMEEDSRNAGALRLIARAAEKGATLTERLLAFARGSASTGSHETVRLDAIARDAIELARPSTPRHIELRLETLPAIPTLEGNATSLGEAILNLLLNGIHACKEGSGTSVTLKISEGDLDDCHLVGAEETCILEVIDDGHGMTDEVRLRVFEPLFTTRTDQGGTGLGCAVAYGVAVEHGGILEVHSVAGEGTIFTFVLPALHDQQVESEPMAPVAGLQPPSGREGPAVVDQAEEAEKQELTGPCVLAVDDEPSVCQLMKDLLEGAGYRVTTAGDGAEALRLLGDNPGGFDLLILDVMMHPMDGTEVFTRAREIQGDLPVLFCSGHMDADRLWAPSALDTVPVMIKPFRAAALFSAVRDSLGD